MTSEGKVSLTVDGEVGTACFFHPKSNSLPGAVLRDLAAGIDKLSNDGAVKVIVLKSEGEKAFCGGASFDEFKTAADLEGAKKFFSGFMQVILAIKRSPKFVVASVQGKAAGGGVGLIAACDYALGVKEASVRLSELAIGIGPFIIGPAVQRKVGFAAFNAMAIDADWRSAEWAKSSGLYQEIYGTSAELGAAVEALCKKLASFSPDAMCKLKKVLWEGTEDWEEKLPKRVAFTSELSLTKFVRDKIASMG